MEKGENKMSKELFYYGGDDDERYNANTLDEYLESFVDEWCSYEPFPEKITVNKAIPEKIPSGSCRVLENLLENLDEDFSDPDFGVATKPTPAMKKAEAAFMKVIRAEYKNYWLKTVEKIEVDLKKWCFENGYDEEWKGAEENGKPA